MEEYKGFGLIPLRNEGKIIHPDDFHDRSLMSDEEYLRKLQLYSNEYGIEETKNTQCSRKHLLEQLK